MSREYPEKPLVGVGALILRGDEILLIKRGIDPGKGLWSIPGGLVEVGETVREAIKREVLEETGLEIEVLGVIDVIDNIVRDESGRVKFHYVIIDFLAKPKGGELKALSDAVEATWVKLSQVEKLRVTKTLKELLRKINLIKS